MAILITTSAFKEYWGRALADYIVTIATYMYIVCSSVSGVSALLVCTAIHSLMTRRHCSKFSVALLSI